MNAIQDTIFDIIAKEGRVERSAITLASTLRDLDVHSLDGIQIVFTIEDTFGITVPEDRVNHATGTVGELVAGVEQLVAAKAAPQAEGAPSPG